MTPTGIAISLIVASRNGEEKLPGLLNSLVEAQMRAVRAELVLVDSASTDGTGALMERFASQAPFPAQVVRLKEPGLGRAHNGGARVARGRLLAFTDDDCRLAPDYLEVLAREYDVELHAYGLGAVVLADPADDPRMANTSYWRDWGLERTTLIPPRSMLRPGLVHGANMLFRKDVFERIGGADPELGTGASMSFEDLELASRATLFGYTGVLLPDLKVLHYPGRRRNSPEADAVVESYARGRGGYYASLLLMGEQRVWKLWRTTLCLPLDDPRALRELEGELRGAADYVSHRIQVPARPGRGPDHPPR